MTLIDELLYELDGESAATGDAATARLDAVLAKIRRLDPGARLQLQTQLDHLRQDAEADLAAVEKRRAKALAAVNDWTQRAASTTHPSFQEQAAARIADARREVTAIEEERAEYQATVDRLAEVGALIKR